MSCLLKRSLQLDFNVVIMKWFVCSTVRLGINKGPAEIDLSDNDLRILMREMQIMKLLNHPNIVKLYEVFEHPSASCLVLEYVDGLRVP